MTLILYHHTTTRRPVSFCTSYNTTLTKNTMLIAQGAHTSSSPFLKIIVTGSFGTLPPFTYMRATPADAPTLLKEVDSATRPLDEAPAPLLSTG
ncbi:hypothetical protein D9758_001007, partial [Tetrapyrgos nigripes]